LEFTVRGETVKDRPVAVRRQAANDDSRTCHLIYVDGARNPDSILSSVANAPVLTVGDSNNFITRGGMIRFTQNAGRIRFEINPDAAERVSLRISSRLLSLADIVRAGPAER
jgi:hypothetical protein